MVLLWDLSWFNMIIKAICLYTTVAVGGMPPVVENTSREKSSVLNFPHSLIICPSLLHLVSTVALRHGSVPVALQEWVEHPYVEKCALPIFSPEICGDNVQSCTIYTMEFYIQAGTKYKTGIYYYTLHDKGVVTKSPFKGEGDGEVTSKAGSEFQTKIKKEALWDEGFAKGRKRVLLWGWRGEGWGWGVKEVGGMHERESRCYHSSIRPKLEYCVSVWDPHQSTLTSQLESFQTLHVGWQHRTGKRTTLQSVKALDGNLWNPVGRNSVHGDGSLTVSRAAEVWV